MKCIKCGYVPERVWWHPYIPPYAFKPLEVDPPTAMPTYDKFWKCPCGQAMGGDGKPFTKHLKEDLK